ncbi:MAG: DUF523 domain-containing protein [Lachnospiraceae bacterium]
MYIIVSSCIMGENCKYNGGNNYDPEIAGFLKDKKLLKVCPELLARLPSPRSCAELVNGMVIDEKGRNVDATYREGIRRALEEIRGLDVEFVILQSRSPTCGVNQIYDGTFSGRLVSGRGLFAEALIKAGYTVIDAEDFQNE